MVAQDMTLNANDRCELRKIRQFVGTSTPADLGPITFKPDMQTMGAMTISTGVTAMYVPAPAIRRYRFEMPLPSQLLVYSTAPPSNHKYVNFFGNGAMGIAPPWSSTNSGLLLVPYQLDPGPETRMLMSMAPIVVDMNNPLDLAFTWEVLPAEVRGTNLGADVVVEIGGQRSPCDHNGQPNQQYMISCRLNEEDLAGNPELTVAASLIAEYIANVMPVEGDRVPLRFGRIRSESILISQTNGPVSQIDLYFGQEFVSELQFVQP
jgi:hypothetical protein